MATQPTAIPAFSPAVRPNEEEGGVGEDEELELELEPAVEEGLASPDAVEEAGIAASCQLNQI